MTRVKKFILSGFALFIALGAAYIYYQNNAIALSHYDISDPDIPESFDDFHIVQVSDLHNKDFKGQLLEKIKNVEPDLIVVTGDVIDRNRTDIPVAIEALKEMRKLSPVYIVSGNHEIASGDYETLKEELEKIDVVNLDNEGLTIDRDGEQIGLIGLEDPLLLTLDEINEWGSGQAVMEDNLKTLLKEVDTDYTVLLSHRAELIDVYSAGEADLVFTGHAHGGQIRIPFIGGLFSPTQGLFPEYTNGVYEELETKMIVSRGLGNSIFPARINNRPDLVVVTLHSK